MCKGGVVAEGGGDMRLSGTRTGIGTGAGMEDVCDSEKSELDELDIELQTWMWWYGKLTVYYTCQGRLRKSHG